MELLSEGDWCSLHAQCITGFCNLGTCNSPHHMQPCSLLFSDSCPKHYTCMILESNNDSISYSVCTPNKRGKPKTKSSGQQCENHWECGPSSYCSLKANSKDCTCGSRVNEVGLPCDSVESVADGLVCVDKVSRRRCIPASKDYTPPSSGLCKEDQQCQPFGHKETQYYCADVTTSDFEESKNLSSDDDTNDYQYSSNLILGMKRDTLFKTAGISFGGLVLICLIIVLVLRWRRNKTNSSFALYSADLVTPLSPPLHSDFHSSGHCDAYNSPPPSYQQIYGTDNSTLHSPHKFSSDKLDYSK